MTRVLLALLLFAITAGALPAFAAEPEEESFWRQLFVMWLPMILFLGLFFGILKYTGATKQRRMIDRAVPHMDALERKLDRIIELLEERRDR